MGRGWMWLAFVAVGAFLIAICIRSIWAVDFWWQLTAGKHVLEHGIPHTDVYSYPSYGRPWFEMRWLYCVLLYGQFSIGPWLVVVSKTAVIVATFLLAFLTERRPQIMAFALLITAISIFASSIRFFERPELWSYLFVTIYIFIIQRWRQAGSLWIWLLPLLQVVWTNTHTLFLIGPIIVFFALASVLTYTEERKLAKTAAIVWIATIIACLANPYGLQGALFPLQLFSEVHGTVFKDNITELRSPFGANLSLSQVIAYTFLIGIWVIALLVRRSCTDLLLLLTSGAMLYLSITAIRNLPLFCITAVPFITSSMCEVKALRMRIAEVGFAFTATAGSLFMIWAVLTQRWIVWQNDVGEVGFGIAPHRYPIDCVEVMKDLGLKGPVFNTMVEGSYLMWNGYQSFIDPRLEVAGEEHFALSRAVQKDANKFRDAQRKYDFRCALIELPSAANAILRNEPGWKLIYFDTVSALYVRDQPLLPLEGKRLDEHIARLGQQLELDKPTPKGLFVRVKSPVPYVRVARFLLQLKRDEDAMRFAKKALEIYPKAQGVNHITGQSMSAGRNWALPIHLLKIEKVTPSDVSIICSKWHYQLRWDSLCRSRPLT